MKWWPFRRNGEPEEKEPEIEEEEYTLEEDDIWAEVTGESEIGCSAENSGNGRIKVRGEKARKMRELDRQQDRMCQDIEVKIRRLKKVTSKLRAIRLSKKGEETA